MPDQRDLAPLLLKHGYTINKKIGEGSFGIALLVEDGDAHQVVCKMVDVSKASAKESQEARREGRLLAQIKHPYIVRYRENFADRGWLGIVMDFCDGGDLTFRIEAARKKREKLPETQVLRWFTQAVLALKYMHGKHILHRDMKPSNIFLTKGDDVRVGDFGISKVMACTAAFARTFVGTPYYLAPEVITEKPYNWPADIWAMGCILYQMCAQKVPFDAANITQLAQKICKMPAPQVPSEYSQQLRDLASEMMTRSPSARPKADAIVNKAFIQDAVRTMLNDATKKDDAVEKPTVTAKYEVMDQFRKFDQNGDGVIDRQELARVLKHLDAKAWTDVAIGQIMSVADTNQDGRIQFEEFLQWIFGFGDSRKGISAKVDQHITLASMAASAEDMDDLLEQLVGWGQYVDMGCLRVLSPDVSTKTCEALAWLSLSAGSFIERAELKKAYDALRQMRAILQAVDQLLSECSRQHVQQIGSTTSRVALKGLCLERADGLRFSDGEPCQQWVQLNKGERIIEVRGAAAAAPPPSGGAQRRRPSPEPLGRGAPVAAQGRPSVQVAKDHELAAHVVIVTNKGRNLEFGCKLSNVQGSTFAFKAKEGEEIEKLIFADRTCTGIKTAPIIVNWTGEQVANVRNAFSIAASAFWPLLWKLGSKMGPRYGSYAMLEGRRLGIELSQVSAERPPSAGADLEPPAHWDLDAMGGTSKGVLADAVAEVALKEGEIRRMQQLLDVVFKPEVVTQDAAKGLAPVGLQLVRASRLQHWPSWSRYASKVAAIKQELAALKQEGRSVISVADPMTSAHLESLGIKLDEESNSRWLFHGGGIEASHRLLEKNFDMAAAGAEDGSLYGRGIYLSEWSGEVDRIVPEGPEGLRCMLICRATLGNILRDDAMLPDKVHIIQQCTAGEHHSILGDRQVRSPGSTKDFVVYDPDQVYPEIVLWYRKRYG